MTVRTAYIGTATALSVLTAANLNKAPGGWIGHVQSTTAQTGITTAVDLTALTLAVTVGSSRRIKISAFIPVHQSTTPGLEQVSIQEGATVLNVGYLNAAVAYGTISVVAIVTPSSGAHTYKLTATTSAGSMETNPAATQPCDFLVEDMGPA